ncbi:hypothetical protein [Variovorax boronicumulans]|uniref:hypothetical protein n=1 Tax=Variovorax boronicumulans TaxID=436515 RepID=UPI0033969943
MPRLARRCQAILHEVGFRIAFAGLQKPCDVRFLGKATAHDDAAVATTLDSGTAGQTACLAPKVFMVVLPIADAAARGGERAANKKKTPEFRDPREDAHPMKGVCMRGVSARIEAYAPAHEHRRSG